MARKKSDATAAALNKELLHSMLLQRRFEERCAEAYAIGKIGGFCHLYIGQEAVSTGANSVLRPDDYVITTYRDHGQALARGLTPRAVMAELPVIYVIENNRYGMGTAIERASAINDIYERAASYDMPRDVCDGQDVFAVRDAISRAVQRARTESVPTLLEVRTYRFMGHSMSDAVSGTYRTKDELEQYLKRDPIALLRARMQAAGEITEAEVAALDAEIKAIVQDAWDFADASPELPPEALYEDVLVDTTSDTVLHTSAAD